MIRILSVLIRRLELNIGITHVFSCINICRCPSLSCPLDSLPPGGQANRGWVAPRGASCPGISCPPPWLSSPPGGKLSRPVYLAPRQTQVKIYTCYFVSFCIILMNSDPP